MLVVIAIMGLIASLVMVGLNQARIKSRDTKRLADVHQLGTAFELFFNENYDYPQSMASLVPAYINVIPTFPSPYDGCAITSYNSNYSVPASPASTYQLLFCVFGPISNLSAGGTHTLSGKGIQ